MRTQLLALVFCAALVSTVAAMGTVAARDDSPNAGNSAITHTDVLRDGVVVGTETVNENTGHIIVHLNDKEDGQVKTINLNGDLAVVHRNYQDEGLVRNILVNGDLAVVHELDKVTHEVTNEHTQGPP